MMVAFLVDTPASLPIAAKTLAFVLFGTAILGKITNWAEFVTIVERYPLVPGRWARFAALAVAALEIFSIALIPYPVSAAWGGILTIGLLMAFAGLMSVALARGQADLNCGCTLGGPRQRISWLLVARNLVLAALISPALAASHKTPSPIDWIDGVAFGLMAFLLSMIATQLGQLAEKSEAFRRRFT